ncbi:MAG: hypothetical protein U0Z26_19715 [Anaerolineales bacterium]
MFNRKFRLHPQYFLYMVLLGAGGIYFVYRGFVVESSQALLIGALLLVVAVVCWLLQFTPVPKVGKAVEAEIAQSFPAESRSKVANLLTDGFTGYQADSVHLDMLKFAQGNMSRLKKLSRALNHQSDFRDAYPILEDTNRELNKNETRQA